MKSWTMDKGEAEKRIFATLLESVPLILWDNLPSELTVRDAVLEAILASDEYSGRTLGLSENVTVPTQALFTLTGNNATLSQDLSRRVVPIELTATQARPHERTFKVDEVERVIRPKRDAVMARLLLTVRGYLATVKAAGYDQTFAAMGAHCDLKQVIVVDEDVDISDPWDVELAVATRFQADRDLVVVPGTLGSRLDPSSEDSGLSAKMGLDATVPHRADPVRYLRIRVPGEESVVIDDYRGVSAPGDLDEALAD